VIANTDENLPPVLSSSEVRGTQRTPPARSHSMHPELALTIAHARQQSLRRSSRPRGITHIRTFRVGRSRWFTLGSPGAAVSHRVRVGH
jgi:hypothetical protein